jgi:hypothetical protein
LERCAKAMARSSIRRTETDLLNRPEGLVSEATPFPANRHRFKRWDGCDKSS